MMGYLFTVVLSAFLLFVIQPLIGKVVLPWFGGSAAVWSTVLLFFQVLLLLGYTYSFLLTTYLTRQKQIWIHSGFLVFSLVILMLGLLGDGLPLLPTETLKPAPGTPPIIRIIVILGSSVGLPFFMLSTTGPLIQSWYAKDKPQQSPYVLYALSNGGSFLALIAYPFLVEPFLALSVQAWIWSLVYVVFVFSVGFIIYHTRHLLILGDESPVMAQKAKKGKKQTDFRRSSTKSRRQSGKIWNLESLNAEEREYMERLGSAAQWLLLSMCTSILLAAVTNQITQDVAPIPLLWVLPLGLYLISFVISFLFKANYVRITILLFSPATLAVVFGLSQGNTLSVPLQIGIYSAAFFLACLACHGELARLRPEPQLLTAYYLIIAMGGLLGNVLVSVLAPLVFDSYWEFHLGFLLCWFILIGVLYLDKKSFMHKKARTFALYAMLIAPVTLLFYTGQYVSIFRKTTVTSSRNFYGTLRLQELTNVADWEPFYVLSHGTTIHGLQYKPSNLRQVPMAYFGVNSGVGRVLTGINTDAKGKRVGVLGLGVGTLAAYGREQDVYRFYEINPDVVDLAEGKEGYLNFLAKSFADIEIVMGDARLSLENELKAGSAQGYDVLVLDVFNGDAIPVHLLTVECFNLYLDHLALDGIIAAHISTSHINLTPLLSRLAEKYALQSVIIEDKADGYPCCQSRWVLMSRTRDPLSKASISEVSYPLDEPASHVRIWTDDYSNPLQVLY